MSVPISLNNVTNLQSTTTAQTVINSNNTAIVTAFGSTVNVAGDQMKGPLDMNSQQILNLPAPATPNSPARLVDVTGPISVSTALISSNNSWAGTNNFANSVGLATTVTFTGTAASVFFGTFSNNISGITGSCSQSIVPMNYFNISSENSNTTAGIGLANILSFYNYGGTSNSGTKYGILSDMLQQAATQNAAPNNVYYIPLAGSVSAQFTAGGTGTSSSTAVGVLQGVNGIAQLLSGATNYYQVTGAEFDVAVRGGASVYRKEGVLISQLSTDFGKGQGSDAGLMFANQFGSPGWSTGFQFGISSQTLGALNTSATILKAGLAQTVLNGIDLTNFTFTGAPYLAPLQTPPTSSSAGSVGSMCWDANFIYICVATNTWKRVALSAF